MNSLISKRILIALAAVALLSAISAYAQTPTMRVNIPFQFLMGNTVMPAGQYFVVTDRDNRRLEIRSPQHSASLFVTAIPAYRSDNEVSSGKLLFYKYGTSHVLRKVWTVGSAVGQELPTSKAEREMARTAAGYTTAEVGSVGAGSH